MEWSSSSTKVQNVYNVCKASKKSFKSNTKVPFFPTALCGQISCYPVGPPSKSHRPQCCPLEVKGKSFNVLNEKMGRKPVTVSIPEFNDAPITLFKIN